MLNLNFTLLLIILGSIQFISTDCPDGHLFCFNSKKELLGKILVNQCWKWSRFSCQPCSASTDQLMISYDKYIHQCRHYHPTTNEIHPWENPDIVEYICRFRLVG